MKCHKPLILAMYNLELSVHVHVYSHKCVTCLSVRRLHAYVFVYGSPRATLYILCALCRQLASQNYFMLPPRSFATALSALLVVYFRCLFQKKGIYTNFCTKLSDSFLICTCDQIFCLFYCSFSR